ncbi:recombinase zinc beta ribbon domain-containing protein, partial [Actinomyces bowdenii]|uniref:recombinase zinc beta ribbon domain-containing protein n=1 Tax=Actinomyces bowdenii TaxID=131109 RepID=UPI0027D4730F
MSKNRLHTLLRHPYYRGIVSFQGVEYPGQHEPLVDDQTWQQVQDILDAHRHGEQQRLHNHHLKTTVVCGLCGSRLLVHKARSHHGRTYPYFVCSRRQRKHDCTFWAVLIDQVETRVAELYRQIHLEEADRQAIEAYLLAELERIETDKSRHIRSLTTRRTGLEDQRRQLLQAHYAGAVPLELLKEEQDRLTRDIHAIQRQLDGYQADATLVRQHLAQALDLLEDCARLYAAAPDHLKKQLNTVFFQRVLVNPVVDEDGQVVLPTDPHQPEDDESRSDGSPAPAGQTAPATYAAGETDAASPEAPSTSPEDSDTAADRPTNRSEAGAAEQQTTRRGTGATGHHAAHLPTSTPGAGPVFTQVSSPGFCGGWFIWCRWLPVVVVLGG